MLETHQLLLSAIFICYCNIAAIVIAFETVSLSLERIFVVLLTCLLSLRFVGWRSRTPETKSSWHLSGCPAKNALSEVK